MKPETKKKLAGVAGVVFVVACMASILFGVGAALYHDDMRWLAFCAPIILFLS